MTEHRQPDERATVTALEADGAVDTFHAALYTQAEASRFLGLTESTLDTYAHLWSTARDPTRKAAAGLMAAAFSDQTQSEGLR